MSSALAVRPTQQASSRARLRTWLRAGRALPLYAAFVVGFMVLVILWGAFVRATGSGAGCGNHWPLCNGDFFPHHPRLTTVIEFTHRSMSGVCTTLVAALIAWTFAARPRGDRTRTAVTWSGILLLTEALLGAVLVKGGYVESNTSTARVVMQCVHFTNTMLLLAAITLAWWWLLDQTTTPGSPTFVTPQAQTLSGPTRLRQAAWIALVSTIAVGATGSVAALADTLFPSPSIAVAFAQDFAESAPLIVRMRWLHPAAAVVSLVFAVTLGLGVRSRIGRWVLGLAAAQVLLGVADVGLLAPIWMQLLHLLGADLYWIALVATAATVLAPRSTGPTESRLAI